MKKKKIQKSEPKARKGTFPLLAFFLFLAAILFGLSTELEEIYILSQSQNPISFIGFVIVITIITTFSIGYKSWKPSKNDGSVNSLFFGTSLLLLVVIVKSIADNYWGALNLAYLFLPLSLIAGTAIIFNVNVLKKVILPSLYALLAWPLILIRAHAFFSEPLIKITSFFTLLLANLFRLPLIESDSINNVFKLQSTGFVASIGVACSGTSSIFAVLILTLPLLFFIKGSVLKKGLWILIGVILAFVGNIIRTFLIFFVAHTSGTELALNIFHKSGGMIIFVIILAIQLLLLFFLKLRIELPQTAAIDSRMSHMLSKRALLFVSFMIVLAFISIQTAYPKPAPQNITTPAQTTPQEKEIEEKKTEKITNEENTQDEEKTNVEIKTGKFILEDIPTQPQKEFDFSTLNSDTNREFIIKKDEPFSYVPPLGGFEVTSSSFDFAKTLFGPGAEYYRFKYKLANEPAIFTDAILSEDPNALLGLSSGYCYKYHNYTILHEERIQIKDDIVAVFYSYTDNRGLNWESIDFITPVIDQDTGKIYYRKIRIIREVRFDLGEDFGTTREKLELFTYQLFDSLFYATN